jgi:hypothetical protein
MLVGVLLLAACGGDGAAPVTIAQPTAEEIAAYCAVLAGAQERPSGETMEMLGDVALPGIADVLDRMLRYAGSGDDVATLGEFNEATCGIRFP